MDSSMIVPSYSSQDSKKQIPLSVANMAPRKGTKLDLKDCFVWVCL